MKKKKNFYNIEKHGITQSLLSMFLDCRQKTKFYLQGLESKFHRLPLIEGTIGHAILQLAYEDIMSGKLKAPPNLNQIKKYIEKVEKKWKMENPRPDKKAIEYLEYSFMTMEATLPAYFDYWKKDFKEIKWLGLEETFCRKIKLADGRQTVLRGKKDGEFNRKGIWLFETKFKSQIQEANLLDALSFETQVMFYLRELLQKYKKVPKGTVYNIIRRNNLRQKVNEPMIKFKKRLEQDIENRPEFYFIRYEIAIDKTDLDLFEIELQNLIKDFYDWIEEKAGHYKNTYACIGKYGRCDFLSACAHQDRSDLIKRKIVFKELQDF
jgi:hypothetical protein